METSQSIDQKKILSVKALRELVDVILEQHDQITALTAAYELELERRKTADGVAENLRRHIRNLEEQIAAARPKPEYGRQPLVEVCDKDDQNNPF